MAKQHCSAIITKKKEVNDWERWLVNNVSAIFVSYTHVKTHMLYKLAADL
jgi:hypothetical protein